MGQNSLIRWGLPTRIKLWGAIAVVPQTILSRKEGGIVGFQRAFFFGFLYYLPSVPFDCSPWPQISPQNSTLGLGSQWSIVGKHRLWSLPEFKFYPLPVWCWQGYCSLQTSGSYHIRNEDNKSIYVMGFTLRLEKRSVTSSSVQCLTHKCLVSISYYYCRYRIAFPSFFFFLIPYRSTLQWTFSWSRSPETYFLLVLNRDYLRNLGQGVNGRQNDLVLPLPIRISVSEKSYLGLYCLLVRCVLRESIGIRLDLNFYISNGTWGRIFAWS